MKLLLDCYTRAKAWQLFILFFIIPMLGQFVLMGIMMSKMLESQGSTPQETFENMLGVSRLIAIPVMLYYTIFLGWYWFCGHELNRRVPDQCRMKTTWFSISVIFPLVYMSTYGLLMPHFVSATFEPPPVQLILPIIPLHFFFFFCYCYKLYFISKNLIVATKQQAVKLEDYIIYIVALWFFPVGIWFVQPKINQLMKDKPIPGD